LQSSISSNAEETNNDEKLPVYRVAETNDPNLDSNLSSSEDHPGDTSINEGDRLIYPETLEASSTCILSDAQGIASGDPSTSATMQIDDGIILPDPVNTCEQEIILLAEEVQNDDEMPNETAASETIYETPVKDETSIDEKTAGVSEIPELIRRVISGDVRNVTQVLDSGHDPDCRHPDNNRTGLVFAAMLGHHRALQLLLDRGASISAEDKHKRTALHYAASEDCK
jgi:ankyrin repeat protein